MKLKEDTQGVHVVCFERDAKYRTKSVSFVVYGTTKGRLMKFLKAAIRQKTMKKKVAEAARKRSHHAREVKQ